MITSLPMELHASFQKQLFLITSMSKRKGERYPTVGMDLLSISHHLQSLISHDRVRRSIFDPLLFILNLSSSLATIDKNNGNPSESLESTEKQKTIREMSESAGPN